MSSVKKIALITSTSNFERHKNTIRAVHRKLKNKGGYALYVLTSYGLFIEETAYDKGEGSIYSLLDEADFDGCIIEANFGVKEMMDGFVAKLKERGIPFVAANFGTDEAPHVLIDGYDYSGANAKNCSYAFDKLGHGAIACAEEAILSAWKEDIVGDADAIALSLQAAERMKKNLLRYITIL